ncbi:hypothetical protein Fmac_004300 [Flemingia macrophylla]|uniref:Uncharacterized protein n=1 Tax=Flemingia macrophylla TaxID=520843 RepID=A0ABD1N4P0_9FABA
MDNNKDNHNDDIMSHMKQRTGKFSIESFDHLKKQRTHNVIYESPKIRAKVEETYIQVLMLNWATSSYLVNGVNNINSFT